MPFDAAVAVPRLITLHDILESEGITPVSMEALAEHKHAQQRKFTAGFWRQHPELLLLAFGLSVVGLVASGALAKGVPGAVPALPSFMTVGWMCVLMAVGLGLLNPRAGVHWEERLVGANSLGRLGVPAQIAELARRISKLAPDSRLLYGELVRDRVVLDPYLLVIRGNELACLGIWEGNQVLARAEAY